MSAQRGYIGLTDPDWYGYLQSRSPIDEVNFWQPHGGRTFRALKQGEPFFFKLRAPLKAIAGFGFFERYEALPAWLAWESFEQMNGAPDFESMLDRILRLRREEVDPSRSGDFQIGCVMIAAPVFFDRSEWVSPPADWARTGIQQGKTYDLDSGEGNRVLRECLDRISHANRYWNVEGSPLIVPEDSPRYGTEIPVRPRLGQGLFRFAVHDAYGGACAVSGEHSHPVLEAAHIVPYRRGGEHRIDNGLLLRRDLHRLYDLGYVTVTPDYQFRVGDRLREQYKNGRSYYGFDGTTITVPEKMPWRPNRDHLAWHNTEIYKG